MTQTAFSSRLLALSLIIITSTIAACSSVRSNAIKPEAPHAVQKSETAAPNAESTRTIDLPSKADGAEAPAGSAPAPAPNDAGTEVTHQAAAQGSHLSNDELELWNDPEFRKRFADSYIAETESANRRSARRRWHPWNNGDFALHQARNAKAGIRSKHEPTAGRP